MLSSLILNSYHINIKLDFAGRCPHRSWKYKHEGFALKKWDKKGSSFLCLGWRAQCPHATCNGGPYLSKRLCMLVIYAIVGFIFDESCTSAQYVPADKLLLGGSLSWGVLILLSRRYGISAEQVSPMKPVSVRRVRLNLSWLGEEWCAVRSYWGKSKLMNSNTFFLKLQYISWHTWVPFDVSLVLSGML